MKKKKKARLVCRQKLLRWCVWQVSSARGYIHREEGRSHHFCILLYMTSLIFLGLWESQSLSSSAWLCAFAGISAVFPVSYPCPKVWQICIGTPFAVTLNEHEVKAAARRAAVFFFIISIGNTIKRVRGYIRGDSRLLAHVSARARARVCVTKL